MFMWAGTVASRGGGGTAAARGLSRASQLLRSSVTAPGSLASRMAESPSAKAAPPISSQALRDAVGAGEASDADGVWCQQRFRTLQGKQEMNIHGNVWGTPLAGRVV